MTEYESRKERCNHQNTKAEKNYVIIGIRKQESSKEF